MKQRCAYPLRAALLGGLMTTASLVLPVSATAASSEWATSEGGAVRIVAVRPRSDGTIPAILEIRLQPGWKTYWLEPGASGIPPQVTVDGASGVSLSGLRFPAPEQFDDGIVRYTGYDRSVALPMKLRTTNPAGDIDLRASVFIGICKDICIPLQADLSLALPAGGADNPLEKARIDDATATLPHTPTDDFKVTEVQVDNSGKHLLVTFVVPAEGTPAPEMFVAGPRGFSFDRPRITVLGDNRYSAEVRYRAPAKDGALSGKSALVVIRKADRAMETSLAFK